MLAYSAQTFALDFTVNLTTDEHDANLADSVCDVDLATAGEQCTLRAAVEQANKLSLDDRVLFNLPANSIITLTEANGGRILISGAETPSNELQIIGTGADNLTVDGGAGNNGIFFINNATSNITEISGLALTGGNGSFGGAIGSSAGQVILDSVYIYDNAAETGGGIYVAEILTLRNSTVSGNTATGNGGGIATGGSNGIFVVNSTVSRNSAGNSGGGIAVSEGGILTNVTVTHNNATNGGGIAYQSERPFRFRNTIIASNTTTDGIGPEIYSNGFSSGGIISEGYNLIGDQQGDSTFTGNPVTYQPTDIVDTDPVLDPILRDNGGKTLTHALLLGSPAINKGLNSFAVDPFNNSILQTDQRGFARISGSSVDIGAFEFKPAKSRERIRFI